MRRLLPIKERTEMSSEGQKLDVDSKVAVVANILEGRAVADSRVDICIRGVAMGFPASLEAFKSGFPFGVTYFVETKVIDDPAQPAELDPMKLVFTPRVVSGFMAKFLRHFLFESKGMDLEVRELDKHFICQFNDADEARRFARYPGIAEKIVSLQKCSNFNELIVK